MTDNIARAETLRQVMEAFNAHDAEGVVSFFAETCVFRAPRGSDPRGRQVEGRDEIRAVFEARFAEVPDLSYRDDAHFVSGDRGVSEWTTTGTTVAGVRVAVRGCDLWTFDSAGQITAKDCFWKLVEAA
jgi:ketosteroid isomerase-like protein